ncbi:hypothetical protein HJX66_27915 (plasmid) [Klebsiella pneumoniae]|nr:hypothetical protein HJX66_27915 [Klebsiella pneumoniae]
MPAFEWVHVQLHQQKGMISLSPPTICNSAAEFTGHVIVSGGGEIYRETLPMASTLHLSTIDIEPEGDVFFPSIPNTFEVVFEQHFTSNINYCYQIWKKG